MLELRIMRDYWKVRPHWICQHSLPHRATAMVNECWDNAAESNRRDSALKGE